MNKIFFLLPLLLLTTSVYAEFNNETDDDSNVTAKSQKTAAPSVEDETLQDANNQGQTKQGSQTVFIDDEEKDNAQPTHQPTVETEDLTNNQTAKGDKTKCHIDFNLSSWSILYKWGKGTGSINCDNGQTANVELSTQGGGPSFGRTKISDGQGNFSKVRDISDLFGSYASAEAHAGIVGSAKAQAMTKGKVSLTLSGTGKGYNFGIAFGKFKITPSEIVSTRPVGK